ncbi:MAG: tRNA guanosine(34) transglycosylase Tgt [Flavobacteriaceae bacterium]|nr:tRNA guanosine(34) transglycosylase Tgt [Flavobacteriaceae bacterium]|tara:strand:- start:8395 stop:9522 length:1128 start_codon:yes stop_codon:yes gene_type:complete
MFRLLHNDSKSSARIGEIVTDHGKIQTPVFMPVGTNASVKTVHQRELKKDINSSIILGNTYHLYLRPGVEIMKKAGGVHKFIQWDRPILTDSGGFQVYSLSSNRKISEEGANFQSHIDGSYHLFTPEKAIQIQNQIGADIIMAFDECIPYPLEYQKAKASTNMTHRWLDRCIEENKKQKFKCSYRQFLFPIVQGGIYKDLRASSAEYVAKKDLPGNAIGGLSVGEPIDQMYEMTEITCGILPKDKPRYLMGVGTPTNILECIAKGVDMFDCVIPTRNGRNGTLYTSDGIINIKNKKWEDDFSPIDEFNYSFVDVDYSKAYLRHLFTVNEILGKQIATLHNLSFYMWLMRESRKHILEGNFNSWKNKMIKKMNQKI